MATLLPGYTFDRASSRYRNLATGRYVGRGRITSLLDDVTRGAERRMAQLATSAVEGRISPSTFAETMRTELRRLHHQQAAMGAGGWDRLGPADFGRIGGRLRADYQRIANFAGQIERGEVSVAQAIQRTNMYAGNARIQYWEADRSRVETAPGMVAIERRLLGFAEHCGDCVDYYEQGWTILGTLPVPGIDSQCKTNCKCRLRRHEVAAGEVRDWIGTKR